MGKSKSPTGPPLVVRTYQELDGFVQAFADGHLNLLILTGGPGLGKSRALKAAIGSSACIIEGSATAFGMYLRLFEGCDLPVLIDDVDGIHKDHSAIRLLKSLCQSEPLKTISWNSDARTLAQRNIPREFRTASKVAIIANDWQRLNVDIGAVEDRGHRIHFEPSSSEVHRQVASWFWDQDVFDFISENLALIGEPSFRHYIMAAELKQAKLDWKQFVLARCLSGKLLVVAQLKAVDQFASEEDRVRAFVEGGHGCRATYFNIAKKLPDKINAPKIILTARPPEISNPLDLVAFLGRSYRKLGNG